MVIPWGAVLAVGILLGGGFVMLLGLRALLGNIADEYGRD
jgi:hypothetical protein